MVSLEKSDMLDEEDLQFYNLVGHHMRHLHWPLNLIVVRCYDLDGVIIFGSLLYGSLFP